MRIITPKRLSEFWTIHPDAETPLRTWRAIVQRARYRSSYDVRREFPTASFLGNSLTVFNIGGNKYRLVVDMRYDLQRIYVRRILTHDDYDRLSNAHIL